MSVDKRTPGEAPRAEAGDTPPYTAVERAAAGLLIYGILLPIGALPLRIRTALGRFGGRLFALLPTKERRIAELQLKVMLPDADTRRIVRGVFAGLGQTLMEALNTKALLKRADKLIDCPQRALAETIYRRGRPVIALTAHTGNWELLAAYMVSLGVPLAAVGRQARGRYLQRILAHLRRRSGVRTLWRGGRQGLSEILSELQAGRVLAALIEQDTRVRSTLIPFFGRAAGTPSALIDLGKKHNAIFVSAFIFRVEGSRYTIFVDEIDSELSPAEIVSLYNQRLEALVRRYPDQWVWFHKRWRSLPDGTRLRSAQYEEFLKNQLEHAND